MSHQTPSAGPAPVTYTREEYARLLAEAVTIATTPGTLLLPTVDHCRALFAAMQEVRQDCDELRYAVMALILDQGEQPFLLIPRQALEHVRVSGLGLTMTTPTGLDGYRKYTIVRPGVVGAGPGRPQ